MTWLSTSEQLDHLRLAAEIAGIEVDSIVLPEEREVELRGLNLHYLDWGTCGRPPIIEALVEQLQLHQPVLVGQSLGALNALTYAARHADEMTALVVVDAGPQVRREGAERIRDFIAATNHLDSLEEFVERARAFNPRRDPRLLRQSLLHNLRRLPDGRLARKSDPKLPAAFGASFAARLERLDEVIDEISCPTLVLRGAESEVHSDEQAERLAQRLLRGSWMRVEGAGHTIQGDNPRALSDAVANYLGSLGSGVGPRSP